ncbi:phosphoribosylanthranilate isomerase [Thalassobacillus sp. CUG 92003]|uniref:phosphoribosylanthranilate isomerase n=1 Tax=Thalassobacillus sp. CUG 92003 TaxID=2736641 RepID=UPI0015E77AFC|nr:phosphoribosylanthranilate isomerase [Thalassobacillus sp. CUG 92003]
MNQPLLKLCGNRSEQDVIESAASNATHLGFIFVQGTKRYVYPEQVKRWINATEPRQQLVGVFIEPTIEQLEVVLEFVPLDIIQLHGNETVSEVLKIKENFNLPVWKVVHHSKHGLDYMNLFHGAVDGYVIDSKVKGAYGGTGVSFDWEAIQDYQIEAKKQGVPCLTAGGITPENVHELLSYHPRGIDISSGTETEERKDPKKIKAIMEEVEQYDTSLSRR